jgi:TetR/AcrR family transcriptional regulator
MVKTGVTRVRTGKRARQRAALKAAKDPIAPKDDNTETRILNAAHAVFVRRGTAGSRMQEIANEAGVNKALLHYYFRSKSGLSKAVFQRVASGLFGRLREVAGSNVQLEDKVRAIIAIYLDQLSRTPYAPAYVISEINQQPDRVKQFFETIGPLREGGLAQFILKPLQSQIDARVRDGTMCRITARQFLTNLVSLCIFPFAARPLLCAVLGLDERGFQEFIEERKVALPRFFLDALRP